MRNVGFGITRWRGPGKSMYRAHEHEALLTLSWSRQKNGQEFTIGARDIEGGKRVEIVLNLADVERVRKFIDEQLAKPPLGDDERESG